MNPKREITDELFQPELKILTCACVKLGTASIPWKQREACGPYWRLYWNDAPGGHVMVDGKEIELKPDRIVLLSPGTVYSTRTTAEFYHFYVHFSTGRPFNEVAPHMFIMPNPHLVKASAMLGEQVKRENLDYRAIMRTQILASEALLALPSDRVPHLTLYDPRIARAMEELNWQKNIGNPELAAMVQMSTNGFLRLFKAETGTSPQAYSLRKRLEDACIMLDFSNSSIDEIAVETGFCDRYHLSRAFKQEYGITPARYRQVTS